MASNSSKQLRTGKATWISSTDRSTITSVTSSNPPSHGMSGNSAASSGWGPSQACRERASCGLSLSEGRGEPQSRVAFDSLLKALRMRIALDFSLFTSAKGSVRLLKVNSVDPAN